jgi:hypothetical protein
MDKKIALKYLNVICTVLVNKNLYGVGWKEGELCERKASFA